MRLVLMHVDELELAGPWPEEAAFIVPGGERTAIMFPFHAIDAAIPILAEALDGLDEQLCDACGEPLACPPPGPAI